MHRMPVDSSMIDKDNNNTTSDNDLLNAKRRRMDAGGRGYPSEYLPDDDTDEPHRPEYVSRFSGTAQAAPRGDANNSMPSMSLLTHPTEQRQYGDARLSSGKINDDKRYGMNARERRSIGDESMDTSIPLARRRGDAAQAKASRLHIDTGHSGDSVDSQLQLQPQGGRSSLPSSTLSHGTARSAPPYKMSFSERESGLPASSSSTYDARGELPPPSYMSRTQGLYQAGSASSAAYRHGGEGAEPGSQIWESSNPPVRREQPHVGASAAGHHGAMPGGVFRPGPSQGTATTPLTAARANAFMPQTATLPSPAYHSTHFMRQSSGSGLPPASATAGGRRPSSSSGSGAQQNSAPPKTGGGLGVPAPPLTARLPDHMRSPPSSKTQFLSLFSNFYDSLNDSRTLKATLEDQVRRSNTLLQTLQRSARVLEMTVDRRLQEERAIWEAKVDALEDRCRRLEAKTNVGSPTPSMHSRSHSETGAQPHSRTHMRSVSREQAGSYTGSSPRPSVAGDAPHSSSSSPASRSRAALEPISASAASAAAAAATAPAPAPAGRMPSREVDELDAERVEVDGGHEMQG